MKQRTSTLLIMMFLISWTLDAQARCRIPKTHVVCHRQCFYNYYGPGAHCNEQCIKNNFHWQPVSCKN